jgi:hypothetical protein
MDQGGCGLLLGVKDKKIVQIKGDPQAYLDQDKIIIKYRHLISD